MRFTSASLRWRVPPWNLPIPLPMPRMRFLGWVARFPRSVAVARFCLPFAGCHSPSSFCVSMSRARRSLAARRIPCRIAAGMRPSSRALSSVAPHPCVLALSPESSNTRASVSLLVVVSLRLRVLSAPGANSVVDSRCASFLSLTRSDSSSLPGSSSSGSGSGSSRSRSSTLEDCQLGRTINCFRWAFVVVGALERPPSNTTVCGAGRARGFCVAPCTSI